MYIYIYIYVYVYIYIYTEREERVPGSPLPHGGAQDFRSSSNSGCYVTKFAAHTALKSIGRDKLISNGRCALHRVDHDTSNAKSRGGLEPAIFLYMFL